MSPLPSVQDVVDALHAQPLSPCKHQAPDAPILSARRCKYLLHWIWAAFDGNVFADQVIVAGYAQLIAVPMYFRRVMQFVDADNFEYTVFLRYMRLVWSNARTFNSPSSPVHKVAVQLEDLWETRVLRAQTCADDEDPHRVASVFLPFLFGLRETNRFEIFVKPVDETIYATYPHYVLRPACLESVIELIEQNRCMHHDDVVFECVCTRALFFFFLSPLPLSPVCVFLFVSCVFSGVHCRERDRFQRQWARGDEDC